MHGRAGSSPLVCCWPAAGSRAAGALLEVMGTDRYPAVRHLAWRSVRRLASLAGESARGYDPSAAADERRRAVEHLRASLGTAEMAPSGSLLALRGRAHGRDLEIGE